MRWIFQLCVLLLVLLSTESRALGKMAVGQNIASGGYGIVYVDCTSPDAPPTLINAGEEQASGYELVSDVRDGPNVYAYVKQNPWTGFDPEGLCWAYAVDACFALWDTGCYLTGNINGKEYGKRMAVTAVSVVLNTASGGGFTGGGLFARAALRSGEVLARSERVVKPMLTVGERLIQSTVVQEANHFTGMVEGASNVVNALSSNRGGEPPTSSSKKTQKQSQQAASEKSEPHGDSNASTKEQHGYEIFEKETDNVGKTGISGQKLNNNETSPRANSQVNKLNKEAGYEKYDSRVIPGVGATRAEAKVWEKSNTDKLAKEGNNLELQKLPKATPQ